MPYKFNLASVHAIRKRSCFLKRTVSECGQRIEIANRERAPFAISAATFDRIINAAAGREGGEPGRKAYAGQGSGTALPDKGIHIIPAGDSLLVEFPSVVEAVQCAVDMQDALANRNQGIADDRKMLLRIGINVGDVMIKDDDLFGDGENVAARLQGLAKPGGICLSRAVRPATDCRLSIRL